MGKSGSWFCTLSVLRIKVGTGTVEKKSRRHSVGEMEGKRCDLWRVWFHSSNPASLTFSLSEAICFPCKKTKACSVFHVISLWVSCSGVVWNVHFSFRAPFSGTLHTGSYHNSNSNESIWIVNWVNLFDSFESFSLIWLFSNYLTYLILLIPLFDSWLTHSYFFDSFDYFIWFFLTYLILYLFGSRLT